MHQCVLEGSNYKVLLLTNERQGGEWRGGGRGSRSSCGWQSALICYDGCWLPRDGASDNYTACTHTRTHTNMQVHADQHQRHAEVHRFVTIPCSLQDSAHTEVGFLLCDISVNINTLSVNPAEPHTETLLPACSWQHCTDIQLLIYKK